jgi:hypothetical protein
LPVALALPGGEPKYFAADYSKLREQLLDRQ